MIHPIHEWVNLVYNLYCFTQSMIHPIHEWVNLFYNLYSLTQSMIHPTELHERRKQLYTMLSQECKFLLHLLIFFRILPSSLCKRTSVFFHKNNIISWEQVSFTFTDP